MLCEYCENELNNVCYSKVNVALQMEQRGGVSLNGSTINVCSRYRGTTAKIKRMRAEEAAWCQKLKAVDFDWERLEEKGNDI